MLKPLRRPYIEIILGLALLLAINAAYAQSFFTGQLVRENLPTQLVTKAEQQIDIVIKNVGTEPWKAEDAIALTVSGTGTGESWGVSRVPLSDDEVIAPGEEKTFAFSITAPRAPGTYQLVWRLEKAGKPIDGIHSPVAQIRVDYPLTRATFVSQIVPDRLAPGERFKALMQYQNAGESSWSGPTGYSLKAISENSKANWGVDQVSLPSNTVISTGQTATITFEATAPQKSGRYSFQWQMSHTNDGLFGEPSPETIINVGIVEVTPIAKTFSAEFMSQNVPEAMLGGDKYTVTVVFKNTGESPWHAGNVGLQSKNPDGNLRWFINRVELRDGETIAPGELKAFRFDVVAPIDAGIHSFQWQLADRANRLFGEASEEELITVK